MILPAEACHRLENLSEKRARMVIRLIEDLAKLEALENVEDVTATRRALADREVGP